MISIVDDDVFAREGIEGLVESLGYRTLTFATAEHFLQSGSVAQTKCLITDMQMPGLSGLDLQRELQNRGCPIPVIFVTAYPDEKQRAHALSAGATCFLSKPFDQQRLIDCLALALSQADNRQAE